MKKINIITVNYNTSLETIKMLESLISSIDYINEIVIVDNNSSENERKIINEYLSTKFIFNEIVKNIMINDNIGYFPGLKVGIENLSGYNNFFNIICNNDIIFNDNFFNILFNRNWDDKVMAIAPSVITIDGIYQNPSQVNKPSLFRQFFYKLFYTNYYISLLLIKIWHKLGKGTPSKTSKDMEAKEIFIGIGAIYVLTPSFFQKNNNLEYPLFLYGEEAFLSNQILKSGGCIFYEPSIEVIHSESVATSKLPTKSKYNLNKKAYKIYKNFYN